MIVAVLSDGGWGTALALTLLDSGHAVTLWGPFPEYVEELRRRRENVRFLPGVPLPASLRLEADLATAVADAELIVLAAPAQYARSLLDGLRRVALPPDPLFVNVAKGIEVGSLLRMSELAQEVLAPRRYAVLSGPSHAEEVARRIPTAVVAAAVDEGVARLVQAAFMSGVFRVYTSTDVVGVELGGALKNVLALAAGVCDGMGFGDNTKAALMTRGIAEMARLGAALGGRPETFSGLSGIGDLIVTCTSRHSRNRHVGEELGRGRRLEDILRDLGGQVAEGVTTVRSAFRLARRVDAETPIIDQVHAALYDGRDPRQAVRELMAREGKAEMGGNGGRS
jgi:glycerol-3-phosphate dehydrogenase (NAD(P)+)